MAVQKMASEKKGKRDRVKLPQPKRLPLTAVSSQTPLSPIQQSIETTTQLQRSIGNQAIGYLLIQPKLTLGPVGDKYEQEADAVAKQVVGHLSASDRSVAQRQEDEEMQLKRETAVQRQSNEGGEISTDIEQSIQSAKGSGQPMADTVRAPMENAFGTDFSGVNIHTNTQSNTLNQSLQARAFTTGQDIFFRQGEYNPRSGGGQELLAHELTHVVQQTGGAVQRLPHLQRAATNNDPTITYAGDNVVQLNNKKKKNKNKQEPASISKPEHSQVEIQNFIIDLWLDNPKDEFDAIRAAYASTYKHQLSGWCDGWSYVLSRGGDELAEIWKEIDEALTYHNKVTMSTSYSAVELARSASLYHIANNDPPTPASQMEADYQEAHYDYEATPEDREVWKHDYTVSLKPYIIKEEIKSLDVGKTLRLTSPVHDGAVKRLKDGFMVAETEEYGVQKCSKLEEVMEILDNWQKECQKNNALFFTQSMVV